jgi:hypothetical protein
MGIKGGNTNGYLYGDFQLLGDGIHIGYNAYGSNGGWVNPANYNSTRISMGYNNIGLYYGTVTGSGTAGPSNLALYMDGNNGRIGIANSSPSYALDVKGSINAFASGSAFSTSILLTATGATANPATSRTLLGSIQMGGGGYGPWLNAYQKNTSYADGVDFSICTNAAADSETIIERLTVLGGANAGGATRVGIGCNAPAYTLDVNGTARATTFLNGSTTSNSIGGMVLSNGTAWAGLTNTLYYPSVSPFSAQNGNDAIGGSKSQLEFQWGPLGGYTHYISTRHNAATINNSNAIDFWLFSSAGTRDASPAPGTGNVNIMSVTAAGVGINVSNPSYTLDVNGTARATTFLNGSTTSNSIGGVILNNGSLTLATGYNAYFGTSTGLLVQGYAGADCYIRTNGGAGTATGSIYFGAGGTNTFTISSNGALSGMTSLLVPSCAAIASTVYAGSASPNTTITSWGDGSGWKFNFLGNTARTSNVLTLVDSGYVGINCNTPQTALDVNGSGQFYQTASTSLFVGNATGAYFKVATGTSGYAGLLMNGYFQVASNGGTSTILFSVPSDGGGNIYWNGTGNFGVGTSSPSYTLDVQGPVRSYNTTYDVMGLLATHYGNFLHIGAWNVAGGVSKNIVLNYYAGNVGIGGNPSPAYTLHVSGQIYATGTITSNSDGRLKNVLAPISNGLEMLQLLNPVSFTMKDDDTSRVKYGFIAQEISNAFPNLVYEVPDETKTLHMTYSDLIGPLVSAVKELSARLSNVEAKLAATTGS